MKKSIALIVFSIILLCVTLVYENSYVLKNSVFASNTEFLSENGNRRFDGSKTFDEISYKYKDIIKDIKEEFDNQKNSINLYSYKITNDELSNIIGYLITCGYYYINNSYSYSTDGKYVVSFTPEYLQTSDEVEKYSRIIDQLIDEVAAKASSFNKDIEKLIYIHNYIVENIEYDMNSDQKANNLFGALVLNKTMCVGYAQAFYRIAEKAGFKTYVVFSETLRHAWNMVNLNGKYYFVDCTWDDPVFDEISLSDNPVSGYGIYKYFMCSEDFFLKNEHNASDYIVFGENIMGVVTSTDYDDFFWRNYTALMKYSNNSWYHDYGYNGKSVHFSKDVKFSIDKITFLDNINYDKKIVRTINSCWKFGIEYYLEFNSTLQNIDEFLYYFKSDGIYRLEEKGRFNGKDDLLIFENPTDENIYDFVIDTENGIFTVIYGKSSEFTDSNATKKTYNIADYFCKAQEHQYVLDMGTEEKIYICTACHNTMKEAA